MLETRALKVAYIFDIQAWYEQCYFVVIMGRNLESHENYNKTQIWDNVLKIKQINFINI